MYLYKENCHMQPWYMKKPTMKRVWSRATSSGMVIKLLQRPLQAGF